MGINNNTNSSEGQGQTTTTTTFGGTTTTAVGSSSPSPLHHNLSSSNMFVSSIGSTPTPTPTPQLQHQTATSTTTTTNTTNLPSGLALSSSSSPSSVAGGFLLPALKCVGKVGRSVIDFLKYNDNNNNDNDSNDSTQRRFVSFTRFTVKILLTAVSVIVWYPSLTSHMVGALQYLWDHQWYVLSMTTSVAILFASLVFTTSYEWMWRWQDSVCGNGSSGGGGGGGGYLNGRSDVDGGGGSSHVEYTFAGTIDDDQETRPDQNRNQNQHREEIIESARRRSRLVVTVDDHEGDNDDDLPVTEWVWKLVRKWTPGFGGWFIYCICMTELSFKLWMEYDVAHEAHGWYGDLELRLVNVVMSMFFLFGAASFQWWYFPTNRHYFTLVGRSSTNGTMMISDTEDSDRASAMQSLL